MPKKINKRFVCIERFIIFASNQVEKAAQDNSPYAKVLKF